MKESLFTIEVHPIDTSSIKSMNLNSYSRNYFIFFFRKGKGIHIIDNKQIKICPPCLHFINPYRVQSFEETEAIQGHCIVFSEEYFYLNTDNKDILFRLPFFSYEMNNFQILLKKPLFVLFQQLIKNMQTEFKARQIDSEKIMLYYLCIILLKLKQHFEPAKKDEDLGAYYTAFQIVSKYKKLIQAHYNKEHFVKFYAHELNCTTGYLNQIVKDVTGEKASTLIHNHLILEAKRLLIHSKFSLKEVAQEVGFQDPSYFTKFFRRYTGYNPLEWFRKNK